MSLEYAEKRIREALKQARGNTARARQQIVSWALSDAALLKALTRHHLNGIVAYHVDRVASGRSDRARAKARGAQSSGGGSKRPLKPGASRREEDADQKFGLEVLKAIASSDAAIFGLETYSSSPKNRQASPEHINAIRQMVERSKTKK